jgi:hypothetical protein
MPELNASIRNIPIPTRMISRPISPRGYPVPWFVAEVNGEYDFRVIGPGKLERAHNQKLCWLCGEKLGRHIVFVIGPMCTVNRVSAEPPSHLACAEYAARACPFLANPRMRRNEIDMPWNGEAPAGTMLKRNPGVTALWITDRYRVMRVDNGILFNIGEPGYVRWYCEGRDATRAEVEESIASGIPLLRNEAIKDGPEGIAELDRYIEVSRQLLPEA